MTPLHCLRVRSLNNSATVQRHATSRRGVARSFSIAPLLAAAAMVAAVPASATVGITPTFTIGLVRVANDGSVTVDIEVCATFDQPVRFIEALV